MKNPQNKLWYRRAVRAFDWLLITLCIALPLAIGLHYIVKGW